MTRSLLALNDSAWLFAESYRTPMQVGMLATFRVPDGRPDFVSDLVARWRERRVFAAPFSYLFKLLPVPGWQELPDSRIDLDYHLRHSALPGDGSQRELGVLVSRLHSSMMVLMLPFMAQAVLGVGGRGNPASNLVISNVPGPAEARYLDGSRMEEIHPVSLLFNGQALNITAVSYDGRFNIGYTGCRDSVPSLQKIAVHSGLELSVLEEAFGITTTTSGRGTSRAARRIRGSVT